MRSAGALWSRAPSSGVLVAAALVYGRYAPSIDGALDAWYREYLLPSPFFRLPMCEAYTAVLCFAVWSMAYSNLWLLGLKKMDGRDANRAVTLDSLRRSALNTVLYLLAIKALVTACHTRRVLQVLPPQRPGLAGGRAVR